MSRPLLSSLTPFFQIDPRNFSELAGACREVIAVWVEAGCDLADELVSEFVSIDSQADDVGKWETNRARDEADFYRTFYPVFIAERDRLRTTLV